MRACSRWSSGAGVSEDGVDLYLCLDSIDMGFFFWETNITNRWASRFPRVVFLACVLSRKGARFFFLGGGRFEALTEAA